MDLSSIFLGNLKQRLGQSHYTTMIAYFLRFVKFLANSHGALPAPGLVYLLYTAWLFKPVTAAGAKREGKLNICYKTNLTRWPQPIVCTFIIM